MAVLSSEAEEEVVATSVEDEGTSRTLEWVVAVGSRRISTINEEGREEDEVIVASDGKIMTSLSGIVTLP